MTQNKKKKKTDKKKTVKQIKRTNFPTIFVVLICVVVFFVVVVAVYSNLYQQKIFPGITIGGNKVEGLSYIEVLDQIELAIIDINDDGLVFTYEDAKLILEPSMTSIESGVSYDVFTFNASTMVDQAYIIGRKGSYLNKLKEQSSAFLFGRDIPVEYFLDIEIVKLLLEEKFSQFESPHLDASLVVNEDLSFSIAKEQPGEVFEYDVITENVRENIGSLQTGSINLELKNDPIQINQTQATEFLSDAEKITQYAPFNIDYDDKTWEISNEIFRTWLELLPSESQPNIVIGLNVQKVESYLDELREEVDVPVQEGKFKMEEGRVVEFQASRPGIIINAEKTIRKITEDIIKNKGTRTGLVVETEEPEITTRNVNDLGINELIGVGRSDFSGSPTNRRANIRLGAEKLNGVLIEPDEEFSLLAALGSFEASEGWLPELVIKGNQTVPELGGGACQFGTTMFRAALNTGFPITNRQNHSYTVSYYFPIGTDATIYDPAPDFSFINDTGHHVLIQTKIEGNIMSFEMYGTNDGRVIEQTVPILSNWIKPPDTKIIETTDLTPGEEKCTEAAHTGVTASFDYKVTYPDETINEQTFTSKYKPWQRVCLQGVEEVKEEPEVEDDSSEDKE
ncbi:VanW family protein [Patescibacteria group bacterium]|nr:VanW family protein [Patescibacteria group bacterium]